MNIPKKKLKPCPICNGKAAVKILADGYCVICKSCKARSDISDSNEDVTDLWNNLNREDNDGA